MKIGVLGPLHLSDGTVVCTPRAPKQRQVLALLLMNANSTVSVGDFIEELWEYNPPSSAVQTLQTYIMQLRKILSAGGGRSTGRAARLVTRDAGYEFAADVDELDIDVFARLTRAANRCMAEGEHDRASRLFAQALDLWRGPALADVRTGPVLRARLVGLVESRLSALEQRIEADLKLGRHHALLSELSVLVERHPMHENLYAQFMLALYRSGRPAQALAVYGRLRRVLTDELGLEPSPPMRRLHEAVLAADPVLDPPVYPATGLSLDVALQRVLPVA
ncbi:AfsR/SARP family transcriptional regulator [Actinosynnema sp. NPDC023658]|uniref:AfsR/SARP family transcriptional regulator n=1 Tax=Actinosynnema sp. NPDC023658 TaxID=3155465 RepID=UPI0033E2A9DD